MEDRRLLRIQLAKANPRKDSCWMALMADMRFAPDPVMAHEMRKKLDLEQFQMEVRRLHSSHFVSLL